MSRKRKKKKPQPRTARPQKPLAPPRFAVGDLVRVKSGTSVPFSPDIPLGGWSGTINEVDTNARPPTCLVEWDQRTLAHIHPIYFQRCERDDVEADWLWLDENDLEPDTGEAAPMEQPQSIVPRPLRQNDVDDRIRLIFGLTSDDPVPPVNAKTSRIYHDYLVNHLSFPFKGMFLDLSDLDDPHIGGVTVVALLPPEEAEEKGLLCDTVEIGDQGVVPLVDVKLRGGRNRELVEDYTSWFINGLDDDDEPAPSVGTKSLNLLIEWGLPGAIVGAILGALLLAVEGAPLAATIGAILLGMLGGAGGSRSWSANAEVDSDLQSSVYGVFSAGGAGVVLGALAGAGITAMIAEYPAALVGGVAGALLGRLWVKTWMACAPLVFMPILGGGLAAFSMAVYDEPTEALVGALYGAGAGAAGAMVYGVIRRTLAAYLSRQRDTE